MLEIVPLDLTFGPVGDFEDGAVHERVISPDEAEHRGFRPDVAFFGRVHNAAAGAVASGVPAVGSSICQPTS